eukprot:COSAG06_NODE_49690_length_323_cov_1.379464_1_plen_54_part_10
MDFSAQPQRAVLTVGAVAAAKIIGHHSMLVTVIVLTSRVPGPPVSAPVCVKAWD